MGREYDWIREWLRTLAQEYRKIAILPMGKWGKICRGILQDEMHMQDVLYLDNHNYDGKTVFSGNRKENWDEENLYLITAENKQVCRELEEQCGKFVDVSQIKVLFSHEAIPSICKAYGHVSLNFLCVGFQKCGTSSLQEMLSGHSDIFLPRTKETFLAHQMYSLVAHENFQKVYAGSSEKKFVGGIEPTYWNLADTVFQYFGPDLKIFMCARNPREALYSKFKMNMRDSAETAYYMEKYGRISPDVFEEWVDRENDKAVYRYMDCVKSYLRYYSKEQIKIVIFEELISYTEKVMNDLQEYLGVDAERKVKYDKMPLVNEGPTVPKDLASVYVNKQIFDLVCRQTDVELQIAVNNLRGQISELTNIEYHEAMNQATIEKLDVYYKDSIGKLEAFMGRSLEGIWY